MSLRLTVLGAALFGAAVASHGQTTLAVIPGFAAGEGFGRSPVSLGDVNGDGIPDLAVGAPGVAFMYAAPGVVRVLSGFDFHVLYAVVGSAPGDKFGWQIARLGDVDGDGVSDFVASAPGPFSTAAGYVHTISGATGAVLRTHYGSGPNASFGAYLRAGGDFDGDGFGDFAASSTSPAARMTVFSGVTGATIWIAGASTFSTMPGSFSTAFLSDRNADGFDELLLGVPDYCNGQPYCSWPLGAVFLAGGPSGTLLSAHYSTASTRLGMNVAELADLNGDGVTEVLFAYSPFNLLIFPGYCTVHDGVTGAVLWSVTSTPPGGLPGASGSSVAVLGDVDGDGVSDIGLGSGGSFDIQGLWGFSVLSGATGALLFSSTSVGAVPEIAAVGDLDGDGAGDWAVGSRDFDAPHVDGGVLRVYSGARVAGATAWTLGGACGAAGGLSLTGTPPLLGTTTTFTTTNGPAFAAGNLVFDVGLPVATAFGDCVLHLDPAHLADWIYFPITLDALGAATVSIPLPPVPLWAGLPVTAQAFVFGAAVPGGFAVSGGLGTFLGY